jgi:hypothetical protein
MGTTVFRIPPPPSNTLATLGHHSVGRVLYIVGGGDVLALSWYHCVRKHAHTKGSGGTPSPPPPRKILNFVTSEAASCDSSPYTHCGLLVHAITLFIKKIVDEATYCDRHLVQEDI